MKKAQLEVLKKTFSFLEWEGRSKEACGWLPKELTESDHSRRAIWLIESSLVSGAYVAQFFDCRKEFLSFEEVIAWLRKMSNSVSVNKE